MSDQGPAAVHVAATLEVSTKTAYARRRAWAAGGVAEFAPRGPPGQAPILSPGQVTRLEHRLDQRTATAGYTDQRRTLTRVAGWSRPRSATGRVCRQSRCCPTV